MNATSISRLPVFTNDCEDLHLGHLVSNAGVDIQRIDLISNHRLGRDRSGNGDGDAAARSNRPRQANMFCRIDDH